MKPILDRGLNVAVLTIANRLFPVGFDVSADAPGDFDALNALLSTGSRLKVWSGASDFTIFGDPEVNYAFRAWHDWCHWMGGHDFSPEGEAAACEMQIRHLRQVYGTNERTERWAEIVRAEVNGQVEYQRLHNGAFPEDQYAFCRDYLSDSTEALSRSYPAPANDNDTNSIKRVA